MTADERYRSVGNRQRATPESIDSNLRRNTPQHLVSRSRPRLEYHLYRPKSQAATHRVLVSIHGVSRNAEEHIELFRELADDYGVMLVAPVFSAKGYRDYQRLGRKGLGPRADLALIRLLNEIASYTGTDTGRVDLFGFSGGAQFVHRFAFVHGPRVRCIALGAAGCYTMPDPSLSYPYGTADAEGLDTARLNVIAAARLQTLVMVGELDDREDDEELNRTRIVRETQGRHRIERARAWTDAMNAVADRAGFPASVRMLLLPGVGHSFERSVRHGGLGNHLFRHCYEDQRAKGRPLGAALKGAAPDGKDARQADYRQSM